LNLLDVVLVAVGVLNGIVINIGLFPGWWASIGVTRLLSIKVILTVVCLYFMRVHVRSVGASVAFRNLLLLFIFFTFSVMIKVLIPLFVLGVMNLFGA
jgi:hypothetical protein